MVDGIRYDPSSMTRADLDAAHEARRRHEAAVVGPACRPPPPHLGDRWREQARLGSHLTALAELVGARRWTRVGVAGHHARLRGKTRWTVEGGIRRSEWDPIRRRHATYTDGGRLVDVVTVYRRGPNGERSLAALEATLLHEVAHGLLDVISWRGGVNVAVELACDALAGALATAYAGALLSPLDAVLEDFGERARLRDRPRLRLVDREPADPSQETTEAGPSSAAG